MLVKASFGAELYPKVAELGAWIAAALDELHHAGMLHGVLSASFIALDTRGDGVLLFGVGATVSSAEAAVYAAPEIVAPTAGRAIDRRADLYALGALLYRLLSGHAPFTVDTFARSLTQVAHAVIAAEPDPLLDSVPTQLSMIVHKLLQKDPSKRYQTASGLRYDLLRVPGMPLASSSGGRIRLATNDSPDVLRPPTRLHGRDRELKELLSAVEMTKMGESVLVSLQGSAGQGKSALCEAVLRHRACPAATYAYGKVEHFQGLPYYALFTAMDSAIATICTEEDPHSSVRRKALAEVARNNKPVFRGCMPTLDSMTDYTGTPSPPAISADGTGHARVVFTLGAMLRIIGSPEKPLVLFLDDVNLANSAMLSLIRDIVLSEEEEEGRFWMFVLAYRPEEIDLHHPLRAILREIDSSKKVHSKHIALGSPSLALIAGTVGDMIMEASDSARVIRLAGIINGITRTSFEVVQISLHSAAIGILHFDHEQFRWVWQNDQKFRSVIQSEVTGITKKMLESLPDDTN
jgi:hypothetical protein